MVDPGATPHNLPRSGVVAFVGREVELNQIHQQLQQGNQVAITALSGMGGIGKTELALQYAWVQEKQNTYPGGICWLGVRESDISTQVIGFAQTHLDLVIPEGLDAVGQVAYCWQHWKPGTVLIVLDDVTDYGAIKPYLAGMPSRFKLLLTTRLSLGKAFQPLDLPVLDEAASLELLRSLTDPERINSQQAEAIALCQWVGYLPLGLELLGRYLETKPDLTLAKLLQRLQDQRLTAQAFKHTHPDMTASLGVVAAFELSWQDLEESVQQLACWLSLFALSPIAWELVEQLLPQINREETVEDRRDTLVALHLLQRVGTGSYQLHQLLREFFAAKRQERSDAEALREIYIQGMIKIAQQIPQTASREVYLAVATTLPHIAEVATNLLDGVSDEDLLYPFNGLVKFYHGQGLYAQGVDWAEKCLQVLCDRLGQEDPAVASSLNNLALLYQSQGRYSEAEPLYQQALQLYQQLLGQEHPNVATSLNNLAELYHSQGRHTEAEPLYQQALQLTQQLLGQEHPDVASSLNNLAALYKSQGRYSEAEPLYQQALQLYQQLLGQEHPNVATSLNNLAELYRIQGRYSEAEPLYQQALQLIQQALGQDHPNVAISLNNLALLCKAQGRYAEAEPLYQQALQLIQQALGQDHPNVATSLNNLAALYCFQGRYDEAESHYQQALQLIQQALGQDHPDVATSLNNLAGLYYFQKRYSEAEPLYQQALQLRRKLLGQDHPDVASSLNNLATLYYFQKRYSEAEPLYQQALRLTQQLLGQDHPNIAISLNNLAGLYKLQERYDEAESLFLYAFRVCLKCFGTDHPNTQNILSGLLNLIKQAIQAGRESELSDHPLVKYLMKQIKEKEK